MGPGKSIISVSCFCFLLVFWACTKEKGEIPEPLPLQVPTPAYCDSLNVKYSSDIQPIIQIKCLDLGCHGTGYASGDFQTYSGVKAKADNGTLKDRTLVKKDMPTIATTVKLSSLELQKIECWLIKGAPNN